VTDAPRPTAERTRWTARMRRGQVVSPAMLLRLSAWAPDGRRRRMLAASLLVHLLLIGLLWPWARQEVPPEPLPPPAVAMIFESGNRAGPSAPEPTPEAAIPAPPEAPAAAEAPTVPPPIPSSPAVAAVPSPPAPPAPAALAEPIPPPPPLAQAPALAPPPVPPAPVPPPQKMAALPMPPLPMPPLASPPLPLPPRTQQAPGPRPPSGFPAPMNYSLGPTRPSVPMPHQNASPNDAVGPVTRGATALGRFAEVTKGKVDADWLNDLHRWWLQHGYYPEQAAMAGEDGTVGIEIVVDRYGRVRLVDLRSRSGSQWLDMGAQAVFRGANLPPFPPGTHDDEVTLDLHINYILVRR
jgi:periplasmic protein TonB